MKDARSEALDAVMASRTLGERQAICRRIESLFDRLQQERDGCTRCGGEDRVLLCRECRGEVAERDARWTDEEVREMLTRMGRHFWGIVGDVLRLGRGTGKPEVEIPPVVDAIIREAKQQREDKVAAD